MLDPKVHRVERDQFCVRHLLAHAALEIRLNVAEKQQSRIFRLVGDLWLEVGKDIQLGVERVSDVQVVVITTVPSETFCRPAILSRSRVPMPRLSNTSLLGEITTDHTDDTDVRKEAGGDGEVRGRTAKHLVTFSKGGFDGVVSNRSNN